ncbi:MAG: glycosyltransferase family 9 protein [Methylophilales bacterium]|nr:glycosyltransferase family 9 protein [Methylophilales bacterium]
MSLNKYPDYRPMNQVARNLEEVNSKILFITLSNIGDAILTTPTLEALHAQFPDSTIDIIGDTRSKIIFQHCPYLGIFYEKDKKLGLAGIYSLLMNIRKTHYELAVDLRSDGLLYFIKAKKKLFKHSNQSTLNLHSAERHFLAIKKVTNAPIPNPKIWISEKERLFSKKVLGKQKNILALGLGANFDGKIWPVSNFVDLADSLSGFFDAVLLLGSHQDAKKSSIFMKLYSGKVIDCAGQTNLLETAALLGKSKFFVGNDSGLGHMASAVGIPSFTIFGVGEPNRYRPLGKEALWYQDPGFNISIIKGAHIAAKIIQWIKLQ